MTDWTEITEYERGLSAADPPLPYGVVWRLLRERERREREVRTRTREAAGSVATLADDVGLALHKLRDFVQISGPDVRSAGLGDEADLLCTIADKFGAALERAGAHVIEPTDQRYSEVADLVEVVYAEPGVPQAQLVVTRTVQAGLQMADSELVRRAKVELGTPPSDSDGDPTTGT